MQSDALFIDVSEIDIQFGWVIFQVFIHNLRHSHYSDERHRAHSHF